MITYQVELGERSYPIYIGAGLLDEQVLLARHVGARALVVTSEPIARRYLEQARRALAGVDHHVLQLPDGEQYKTLETVNRVFDELLEQRFDRQSTLIALGGGVIGDITGFAAACYQRGVDFVQIPTTLLAQVDSSVGGKTGVNHALGKNMIGAFHQPRCVLADTATLHSLPAREFRSGLAEVIKYGLIRDSGFFAWLEDNIGALLERSAQTLAHAVARSCENKAQVVAADEREQGQRALLNLGHTFGHAIEAEMGFGKWTHGEAVAAGMCLAAEFSRRLGWLEPAQCERSVALIAAAGLPTRPPRMGADAFLSHMARDKKVRTGRINLVLMHAIGSAAVTQDYPDEELRRMLAEYC